MKNFIHMNARPLMRLYSNAKIRQKGRLMAGGTDLLGKMKDEIMPDYPEVLVNIKTIPDLDFIDFNKDSITIGALTRLEDIAQKRIRQ
jgi:CO/xanthine dehydrogenase FAD-binding subunit